MNNKLNIKAMLIGIATMVGVSFLMGLVMTIATIVSPHFLDSLVRMRSNNLNHFLFVGAVIPSIAGGFVTGWIAKQDRIKNAFALAIIILILHESTGMLLGHGSVLYRVVGETTGVLATIFGGYVATLAFGQGRGDGHN